MKLFKSLKIYWVLFVILVVVFGFFHKSVFFGQIPFPGDLLVGSYEPYKSFSHLGFAPGGVPHKGQGSDVIRELIPWKEFSISLLKSGQIPLWNPYNFSGNPHLANLQSGTFYIGNIAFFLLPFFIAWTFFIILQPILAYIFTYLFLRELKLSKIAALFGGLAFTFSGFMVVWIEYGNLGHTFLWLPLVLWCILRFLTHPKIRIGLLLVVSLVASIFAGYIQLAIYLYAVSLFFLIYLLILEKNKSKILHTYFVLLLLFAFPVGITAIQLIPTLEILSLSLRDPYSFAELSERLIPFYNSITLLVPDFFGNQSTRNYWLSGTYIERVGYIGVIPFIFALFNFFIYKNKYVLFFGVLFIVTYLSTLDILPVKIFHGMGLPFISTGVPSRILGVAAFSLAVLCGFGVDFFLKEKPRRSLLVIGVVGCVFLGVIVFAYTSPESNFLITRRTLIAPTIIFVLSSILMVLLLFCNRLKIDLVTQKKLRVVLLFSIFFLSSIDLYYFFQKITPFAPIEFAYPQNPINSKLRSIQGIDRNWGYGFAAIEGNFQLYERNYSPEGYDALFLKRYGEFISASERGRVKKEIPANVAPINSGFGIDRLTDNPNRIRVLDILGVSMILNKGETNDVSAFPKERFALLWQEDGWQIYENMSRINRAQMISDYEVLPDDKILNRLFDPSFDPRSTVLLEEDPNFKTGYDPDQNAQVTQYKPNFLEVKTTSKENNFLVISDNMIDGWRATIDGMPTKVYRANYAFRAVPIEKGNHTLKMWYEPESFRIGSIISGASIIALGVFLLILRSKWHEKK